ncbi:MAG: hypothetical protein IPK07_28460 [Deltaproteobacteria bacterium]|nr:hypothetical protein [Deltaproteobacteria bacterium]
MLFVIATFGCGGSSAPLSIAQLGVITDLGSLDEPRGQSIAKFINDRGEVVGSSAPTFAGSFNHTFRWTREGGLEDLSDAMSSPNGLSESGDVVGEFTRATDVPEFVQPYPMVIRGTERIRLSDAPGIAWGVNDLGVVVGCEPDGGTVAGRCWTWDGGIIEMLPDTIRAVAINNEGEIVGFPRDRIGGDGQGLALQGQEVRRIPTFGGLRSRPADIDEQGRIVGGAERTDGVLQAFLAAPDGSIKNLGSLADHFSEAVAINEQGVVVGSTAVLEGGARAFIYHRSMGLRALEDFLPPDSGWTLEEALDVNESNQIVGRGSRDGLFRAFLLDLSVGG